MSLCKLCKCPGCAVRGNEYDFASCPSYEPMNHADRIRAMTDEELAAYLGYASLCVTIQGEDGGAWCSQYGNCNECIRDWLRQEAT